MSTLLDTPADPVRILLEERDPGRRVDAHLALAKRAVAREDLVTAHHHFAEAADLDPTDERPRAALRRTAPRRRSLFGRFLFGGSGRLSRG